MKTTIALDASDRAMLSREQRRVANPSGQIVKRGKLKIWTGAVPATPIEEAVEQSRHYTVAKKRSGS